jgi:3-oxoacyl-(acyl-carrier-protein) synthase
VRDLKLLRFREDAITRQLARYFGCSIRKFCVGMQCTSSILAISTAVRMIEDGREDYVLVGAYDFFEPSTYFTLHTAGLIDAARTDPYSVRHNGFNVADGAGFLVLESEEAACKRGAKRMYGKIRASALACESTEGNPSVRCAARVVEECLGKAGLKPSDLGLISPHGCGVPALDRCESIALRRVLGHCVDEIPFAYFTNSIGYTFAASAFLDIAALLTGIQSGHWPKGSVPSEPEEVSRFRFLCQPEPCGAEENILKLKIAYSGAAGALMLTGARR